ncbi:MAG: hypothetical protein PHO08_20380 [Methylococcales bacterium]|nr:hypothetical protein [Methylococcales bacterium]MDD5632454.1 hypothetical protein [Methylococcales bacterium]
MNRDAASKTQVAARVLSLLDQLKKNAETLQAKDLKIQALILELAHLRRIRYNEESLAAEDDIPLFPVRPL